MPDMGLKPHGAHHIAPDAHGQNFYAIDRGFQDLLALYLEPSLLKQMTPHFDRLGTLAGNRLDELAQTADKHPPVLQPRDRQRAARSRSARHELLSARRGDRQCGHRRCRRSPNLLT